MHVHVDALREWVKRAATGAVCGLCGSKDWIWPPGSMFDTPALHSSSDKLSPLLSTLMLSSEPEPFSLRILSALIYF